MTFKPRCLATGIGSVPHSEPDQAVQFVFSYFPEVPYWPQLPMRGSAEGFLNQFIGPLIDLGLVAVKENKYYFDTEQEEWGAKLARFYETYMAALEGNDEAINFFRFPEDSASGFYAFLRYLDSHGTGEAKLLKGQISGPLTVGLALTDQDRRAVYYNPQARDVLIKTLAMQGLWQARVLSKYGLPVIVFVDDPGLYASGQSTFITLKKEEITSELNSIYEAIKGAGAIAGTHSCSGMDWSILFESDVDIVSFDAFEYFTTVTSYPDELKSFIERGGCLAWGIVPTSSQVLGVQTVQTLAGKLDEHLNYLEQKGLNRSVLLEQAMITPSCGTGTLSMEMAVKAHELSRDLAVKLRG